MNVTDIDDKIIKRSVEEKMSWKDVARKYENEFWNDLQRLNVSPPDIKIRVSDTINLIVEFIKQLIDTGYAYGAKDGSVYFRTKSFNRYGKLQKISDSIDASHETDKEFASDFALWKGTKANEPFWESPWGNGRPGWHIECSTMATFVFGNSIDFHAGGLDLRFPHHENEEAQSCCFHNTDQWINYWIHTGQLKLTGEQVKMSKSLKNTISINDLLKTCTANQFRMLCMLSRYHSEIDYGDESTKAAKSVLQRIMSFLADSKAYVKGDKPAVNLDMESMKKLQQETKTNILECFKDDFNTPKAIERLLYLISETNRAMNSKNEENGGVCSNIVVIQDIHNFVKECLENLGFQLNQQRANDEKAVSEEKLIHSLVDIRQTIRQEAINNKNKSLFSICDRIRYELLESGIEIKDHGQKTTWKRKIQ